MYAHAHPHWNPSVPTLHDEGKEVQLLMEDGSIIQGVLRLRDVLKDARGGKTPIFEVEDESGTRRPFVECEQWRFLSERPQ